MMSELVDFEPRLVDELGKRLGNFTKDGIYELLSSKMSPQQAQLMESSIDSAVSKVEYAFKLAFEFEIRRSLSAAAARTDGDGDAKSSDGKSAGNASPTSPRSQAGGSVGDHAEADAAIKSKPSQQPAQDQDLLLFQKESALDEMVTSASFRTAAQQSYLMGLTTDTSAPAMMFQDRVYSPDSSHFGNSSGPSSGTLPAFSSYNSSSTASSADVSFGGAPNVNMYDNINNNNFSPTFGLDAGGNFLYNGNNRQEQLHSLQQPDAMLSLSQLLHASRATVGQQWPHSEPLVNLGMHQQRMLDNSRPTNNNWAGLNLANLPLQSLLPQRFAGLPTLVQMRLIQLTQPNSVITLNDFDDKVVGKMATLVESYGVDACLAMLGHLEHRMRTKHVAMRNGPGYLDVAVSRHLDMLKAQRMCPNVNSMQEYAQLALGSPLYDQLRMAVDSNRWLKWEHLDQNIIQLIRKLPRDVAVEQLQELCGQAFHNSDNMRGELQGRLGGL